MQLSLDLFKKTAASARSRHDAEMEIRAYLGMGLCYRRLGNKKKEWLRSLSAAEDIVARRLESISPGTAAACASAVLLQRTLCQVVSAKYVTFVLDQLKRVPPLHPDAIFALCDAIEAHLIVLLSNCVDDDAHRRRFLLGVGAGASPSGSMTRAFGDTSKKIESQTSVLCSKLRAISKVRSAARAPYKRLLGLLLWYRKRRSAAISKWRGGLAARKSESRCCDLGVRNRSASQRWQSEEQMLTQAIANFHELQLDYPHLARLLKRNRLLDPSLRCAQPSLAYGHVRVVFQRPKNAAATFQRIKANVALLDFL